jgi:nitrite reductase/ring-hydroxylating ferredoxin subunit
MQIKRFFYIIGFFILINSCKSDYIDIPDVYVNIAVDLNDPDFFMLNAAGNGVEISGGYAGIIVYRQSSETFAAYERACPYSPYKEQVSISDKGSTAVDTVCGSEFSLIFDGAVMSGPAPYPLKKYSVSFNASSSILYIFN